MELISLAARYRDTRLGVFFILLRLTAINRKGGDFSVARGKVKWFSNQKGYGFITLDSGNDVFVHHNAIQGEGFRTLEEGQEVEFEVQDSPKGEQAIDVVKL
jgi:CspA family cold shock protein